MTTDMQQTNSPKLSYHVSRSEFLHTLDKYPEAMQFCKLEQQIDTSKMIYAHQFIVHVSNIRSVEIVDRIIEYGVANSCVVVSQQVICDADFFLSFKVKPRRTYLAIHCVLYAVNKEFRISIENDIKKLFARELNNATMVIIDFVQGSKQAGVISNYISESFDITLIDEAYPGICARYGSVDNFIDLYMKSSSSVLILGGPPGTGKTRLIKYIIQRDAREIENPDDTMYVMYANDNDTLESDGLYTKFLAAEDDTRFLIVEDVDFNLKSRESSYNPTMNKFLVTSDGMIDLNGGKIIFSTNIHIHGIDPALMRTGRCFDALSMQPLNSDESVAFLAKMGYSDPFYYTDGGLFDNLQPTNTISALYGMVNMAKELDDQINNA